MTLDGKKLPILVSAGLALCIFLVLYFQSKSGDNEVAFAYHSEVFNNVVRQYLLERRSFLEKEGHFPHDAYYFDEILKLLKVGSDGLKGEEKAIIDARIMLLQKLKPLVVNLQSGQQTLTKLDTIQIDSIGNTGLLEEKKSTLQNLLILQRELEEFEKNFNWQYASEMEAGEVEGWKIERELTYAGLSFLGELRIHWRKLMSAKRQNLEVRIRILELLEDSREQWVIDPQSGAITFPNKGDISREYQRLGQILTEILQRQDALFKESRFLY